MGHGSSSENGPPQSPKRAAARLVAKLRSVVGPARGDLGMLASDALVVVAAYMLLFLARFEFAVPERYWSRFEVFLPVALVVHLAITALAGAYGRSWRHASIDEARRVVTAGAASAIVLIPIFGRHEPNVPQLVLVTGPMVVVLLQGLLRFQSRLFPVRQIRAEDHGLRVAIVGAGNTGAAAIREMRATQLGLVPVAVVDDDVRLHGRSLLGVPIVGGIDQLGTIVEHHDVHQVLLAIPSEPDVAERVADAMTANDVPVRVLPRSSDWVQGGPSLRDVRDLAIEDLLGRREVHFDLSAVRELIGGRRVLITGAGGSIGSEIARQVAALGPDHLVLLDHDETHLHDAITDLPGRIEPALADVRDPMVMAAVFQRHRPEIVFHAAAHKHVPMLERFPCEAVRTNVLGTLNVLLLAEEHNVEQFVCISTDKAADPTNAMGASKWIAEQLVLAHAPQHERYRAVRFGNVIGSRGSVIPLFQRQIAAGGPVTVTDPRMTRWFMSIDESVRLVLQAAAIESSHRILALRMGLQVNIYELAERMIRLCGLRPGRDIEISITGMRPGEKLSEALVGPGEELDAQGDGLILGIVPRRVAPDVLARSIDRLTELADTLDGRGARDALLQIAALDRDSERRT